MLCVIVLEPVEVFTALIGRGRQVVQARPVSQLFPLADRAEHLALPRHKTEDTGPGLARRRVPSPARVVLE